MDSQDSLAIIGKKHQISFPMTQSLSIFNLRGALVNRDAILDRFCGRSAFTSPPATLTFGSGQITTPTIIVCAFDLGINKTINRLMTNTDRFWART